VASRYRFLLDGREHSVVVDRADGRTTVAVDDGDPVEVDVTSSGLPGLFSMLVDGEPSTAYVSRRGAGFEVTVGGRRFALAPGTGAGRTRGTVGGLDDPPGQIMAPLAGVVVEVRVNVGDAIEVGQTLIVVEAMKMQNELRAPHAGVVTAIHFGSGDRVEQGILLLEYELSESE